MAESGLSAVTAQDYETARHDRLNLSQLAVKSLYSVYFKAEESVHVRSTYHIEQIINNQQLWGVLDPSDINLELHLAGVPQQQTFIPARPRQMAIGTQSSRFRVVESFLAINVVDSVDRLLESIFRDESITV